VNSIKTQTVNNVNMSKCLSFWTVFGFGGQWMHGLDITGLDISPVTRHFDH